MMKIAIASGKGGTGKTFVATNIFYTLLQNDYRAMLVDCDAEAPNSIAFFETKLVKESEVTQLVPVINKDSCTFCGKCHEYCNYNAIFILPPMKIIKVIEDLCHGCGTCESFCRFDAISFIAGRLVISAISCDGCFLCSHICPENAIKMVQNDKSRMYSGSFRNGKMVYGQLSPGEDNSGKLVNMVREKAKEVAKENNLDTIILDGPPGIGCPVISTITGVDKVVIVTEASISGLHDMQRTIEIVKKFNLPAFVVINKYDLNTSMSKQIEEWCNQNEIAIVGQLPFDRRVTEAMVQSKSITEFNPDNEISNNIKAIWNKILNQKK